MLIIKIIKRLAIKNKKKWQNKIKKEVKPKGVWAEMEVQCWNCGPLARSPVWLSLIACSALDSRVWYSAPFVLWICTNDTWLALWMRFMVFLLWESAHESNEKNDMEIIGDLGRTYSAVWASGLGKGCFSFRVWQGIEPRACLDLKMLATMF